MQILKFLWEREKVSDEKKALYGLKNVKLNC